MKTDPDELDLARAEDALFGAAPRGEPRAAPEAWDLHLAGLLSGIAPVEPPLPLRSALEAQLDAEVALAALEGARRALTRWRCAAVAAGSLAACLAIMLALPAPAPPHAPSHIALVVSDADPSVPGMVVIGQGAGDTVVVPLLEAAGKMASWEMWHLPEGADRPRSLGLLPQAASAGLRLRSAPGDLFAISLEGPAGSPTGTPTTPLFHGSMVPVPD